MESFLDILSWISLSIGGFFCIVGALGIYRFPDIFSRMHAQGVIDTGGVAFILLGLVLQSGFTLVSARLILLGCFIFFISPPVTYILVRTLLHYGDTPIGSENLNKDHKLGHEHDTFEAEYEADLDKEKGEHA
ncbi:MAG: cation:proton antiporter [Alphaproteobacteria bacterium]